MKVGIDDISLFVPEHYFPLEALADRHGIDPDKYTIGIGQAKMAVAAPDEDIVTMAAEATYPLLADLQVNSISTIILATESGVDQSKSAGLFVHGLLNLHNNCRVVEFKQACYGATAAVQFACDLVRQRPKEKVLIIASDIARYERDSEGECTQGAGAIAMVISANPRLLSIHKETGFHSYDVMDFWRPNTHKAALVNGKLSIKMYLASLQESYEVYRKNGGHDLGDLSFLCFHQPFTRMAKKAFDELKRVYPEQTEHLGQSCYEDSTLYGRDIGNTYTASLYIALLSLLDNQRANLAGRHIGFFSYGSGSVGEFFSATVEPGYKRHLRNDVHRSLLDRRSALTYDTYCRYAYESDAEFSYQILPKVSTRRFRLDRIEQNRRIYQGSKQAEQEMRSAS